MGGGARTHVAKAEYAAEILTRSERLDPRLPAISARLVLDSCKNLRGKKRRRRQACVSATSSHDTGPF